MTLPTRAVDSPAVIVPCDPVIPLPVSARLVVGDRLPADAEIACPVSAMVTSPVTETLPLVTVMPAPSNATLVVASREPGEIATA